MGGKLNMGGARGARGAARGRLALLGAAAAVIVALLVLLLAVLPGAFSAPETVGEQPGEIPNVPVTVEGAGEPEGPTSTPVDLWAKGSMPYLYQTDPQWADVEYSGGVLSKQGCGPTALDMVYIYLTGDTSYDPAGMAAFATENGYSTDLNGSSWELMTTGAAKLGLTGTMVSATVDSLRAELEAGRPVICVMNPGTFTEVGHYIVLERLAEDGTAVVHDSNSVGRSMRTWSLDLICSEAAGAWSFTVAS